MTTEKEQSKSMKNSEEKLESSCSLCSEKGAVQKAKKLCVECKSYLCDSCLQYHQQFPALRLHVLVDHSQRGSVSDMTSESVDRCFIHPEHCIDIYCDEHEEVCCEACIPVKHRSCVKVYKLADVAKGITDSKEHKDINENLEKITEQIKQEREKRSKALSCLDKKKDLVLKDIDEFQDKLVQKIKELAVVSRKEVVSKHAEHVQTVRSDITKFETMFLLAEASKKKISASGLKEQEVFINIKNGKKLIRDTRAMIDELSNNQDQHDFYFSFDEMSCSTVMKMVTFGNFDDAKNSLSATKYKTVNVKCKEVNDICIFENGSFVTLDCARELLTWLNSDYAVTGSWKLNMHPLAFCATGPQEVALALRDRNQVQFITLEVGTNSVGSSFEIPQTCTSLGYDSKCDQLYICFAAQWGWNSSGRVEVYKRNGTLMKTYDREETGLPLFYSPNRITITSDTVYVTDSRKGLVALNKDDGKKLWTLTDLKLKNACGVCLLSDAELLVTGLNSNNILHIAHAGKEILVYEFLGAGELLNKPFTVVFDKLNSRILIGCISGAITVYTLSRLSRTEHSNYSLLNMKV